MEPSSLCIFTFRWILNASAWATECWASETLIRSGCLCIKTLYIDSPRRKLLSGGHCCLAELRTDVKLSFTSVLRTFSLGSSFIWRCRFIWAQFGGCWRVNKYKISSPTSWRILVIRVSVRSEDSTCSVFLGLSRASRRWETIVS